MRYNPLIPESWELPERGPREGRAMFDAASAAAQLGSDGERRHIRLIHRDAKLDIIMCNTETGQVAGVVASRRCGGEIDACTVVIADETGFLLEHPSAGADIFDIYGHSLLLETKADMLSCMIIEARSTG